MRTRSTNKVKNQIRKTNKEVVAAAVIPNTATAAQKLTTGGKFKSPDAGKGKSDETTKSRKPLCLNPICRQKGIRHWTKTECDITTEDEAQRLVKERREENKKGSGGAKRVAAEQSDESLKSTLIRAMFSKTVCSRNRRRLLLV